MAMSRRQVGTIAVSAAPGAGFDGQRLRAKRDRDGLARRGGLGLHADPGEQVALLAGRELRAQAAG